MTREEYIAAGLARYGDDHLRWRFRCPSCGHVATPKDWKDAGAPETAVAFSCVGRWLPETTEQAFEKKGGPCNYAGGGLFKLNPITVTHDGRKHSVFDFADEPLAGGKE